MFTNNNTTDIIHALQIFMSTSLSELSGRDNMMVNVFTFLEGKTVRLVKRGKSFNFNYDFSLLLHIVKH